MDFEGGGPVLSGPEWGLNKTVIEIVHGAEVLRKQNYFTAESWNVGRKDDNKSHNFPINEIMLHGFTEYSG